MQPLFHNRSINPFDAPINRLTDALAERWALLPADQPVMMEREMGKLTFEAVGTTLFGVDIEQHAEEISRILDVVNVSTQELRSILLLLLPRLPLKHTRASRDAVARLDRIVFGMIDARRASSERRDDILDRLLAARDEDSGAGMDERQIRDEVVTLLLAGHETSSHALAWTFWMLTQHRDVEARLLEELASVLNRRPAQSSDLAQLPYLKQVVQESMRLLPPVWAIARMSHQDEVFQGHRVPAGSYITIPIYALHRHPAFWPDPERFDPERFNPNRTEPRHSYCYIPFAAGPRTCIGAGMAMLEIQLVIANLLPRFRMEVAPGARIEPAAKVTLTPKFGMPMLIAPRHATQP
jgi:cytochrome P450